MPLYEFECRTCHERFEDLVRSSDADQTVECPACGAEDAVRLLSAPAFSPGGGGSSSLGGGGGGGCGSRGGFT